ncbi:MAG: YncE family protein [Candidatus Promineifilaceae bacterium]|nr:YncE family protein [Candidatus Promineifilaceae bacterium]
MKRTLITLLFSLLAAMLLISGGAAAQGGGNQAGGKIVVANRASGTISVIDTTTDQVIPMPTSFPGPNPAQPMYVVYSKFGNRVFVGDRGNNQVVVFDADDFNVEAALPAGNGVFHMWADSSGRQLWVTNEDDKTATVIDTHTLQVITTVPMPADLVAQGGKPHDVILDRSGRFAYVTMLGFAGPNDYVVQFSTKTFGELKRAPVGKDPHLALDNRGRALYVPAQNSNIVTVLDRVTLAPITDIAVPGAHGAGMRSDGKIFYTTNLPGGGIDGLYTIDTKSNQVLGSPVDTAYPTPHNIAMNPKGTKIYVTHSGPTADKVTVYSASKKMPVPVAIGEITVGMNPFGLAYVP